MFSRLITVRSYPCAPICPIWINPKKLVREIAPNHTTTQAITHPLRSRSVNSLKAMSRIWRHPARPGFASIHCPTGLTSPTCPTPASKTSLVIPALPPACSCHEPRGNRETQASDHHAPDATLRFRQTPRVCLPAESPHDWPAVPLRKWYG